MSVVKYPGKRRGQRLWAIPPRYALITLGSVLLFASSLLADNVAGRAPYDWRAFPTLSGTLCGFACLLLAAVRFPGAWTPGWRSWLSWRFTLTSPRAMRLLILLRMVAAALVTTLAGVGMVTLAAAMLFVAMEPLSAAYLNDVISFTYINAKSTLAGRNPYTDGGAFAESIWRFPGAGVTPLRRGVFGHGYGYPLKSQLARVERLYRASLAAQARQLKTPDPTGGAYDPRVSHSYPALSFLLYVPLIWLGVQNVLALHLLVYCALLAWLVWLAPPAQRPWAAMTASGALILPIRSLLIDAEIVCLAFLLLAWHMRGRRWWSATALGLGCAFKQYCWLFVPFFLLEAWLTGGWREALRRTAITAGVFLAPNLPYIIASPGTWLTSMALPVSEPLFPMGMGFITLPLGGWLPFLPAPVYAIGEALALGCALWAYARWRRWLGETALLLALTPLLFAFRSPANYFAIAPWLALYAVTRLSRSASAPAAGYATKAHANVLIK